MTWTVFVMLRDVELEEYGPYHIRSAAEKCAKKESVRYGIGAFAEVYDNDRDQPVKVFQRGHEYSLKKYLCDD